MNISTSLGAITLAFAVASAPALGNAECGPVRFGEVNLRDGETRLMASTDGAHPTVFYRSNLDINTDGASRSYHPDDPRGKRLALNNMANAITRAWDSNGREITCDIDQTGRRDATLRRGECFNAYIQAFEGARNNDFSPDRFPKIETRGIIPWGPDESDRYDISRPYDRPCLNAQGYFVSQTSLALNSDLPVCEQSRYVDALAINAVVYIPGRLVAQGVRSDKGDLVVVRDRATGRFAFAINGDSNSFRIGEGTPALAAKLSGRELRPEATREQMRALIRGDVEYLVFPRDDVERYWRERGGTTQERIDQFGQSIFDAWGGKERFEECSRAYTSG